MTQCLRRSPNSSSTTRTVSKARQAAAADIPLPAARSFFSRARSSNNASAATYTCARTRSSRR